MAGRCPPELEAQFIKDCSKYKTSELIKRYNRKRRTINEWKQHLRAEGKLGGSEEEEHVEGASFKEDDNYAEAKAETIQTLDQLLSVCKVDESVWAVKEWKPNCWQVGAKEEHADLAWAEGKVSGWLKKFGLKIHNLWQVKATLIRKDPIAIHPTIQPLVCSANYKTPEIQSNKSSGRALILPDAHFGFSWHPPRWQLIPFHDRDALDLALQIAAVCDCSVAEILGDWQDMTMWQDKFAKLPEFYNTTQPALVECFWWLEQFRKAMPDTEIRYHSGNHEARMEAATALHLQEAYNLYPADRPDCPPVLSMPNLLGLPSLGITYINGYPDDFTFLGPNIQVQHGNIARQKPLATVTELLRQGQYHQVTGHIHRDELVSEVCPGGAQVTAYCPGCLCHIDGRVPGGNSRQNWRQGVGILEWEDDLVSVTHIPFIKGRAVWNGQVFTARDRLPDLKKDLPDWNW